MVSFLRKSAQLAVLLAFAFGAYACGDDDPGGMTPTTTGTIAVTVTGDGSSLGNVLVQLFSPGSANATEVVATGNNGVATFDDIDEGEWEVEVVPPAGFDYDQGQEERQSVSVVAGQTATSSFALIDVFQGEDITASDSPLSFSPSSLSIPVGTSVRWTNVGVMLHTVTPDGHSEWMSSNLSQNGSTFIHEFNTPGTYMYYCDPHRTDGMTGVITVN